MATSGLVREAVVAEALPAGMSASQQVAEQQPWNLIFSPVLFDRAVMPVTRREYRAAERALAELRVSTGPLDRESSVDHEFEAILKMKAEPLVLTPDEAEVYTRLRQRRARRVGKPLPLE